MWQAVSKVVAARTPGRGAMRARVLLACALVTSRRWVPTHHILGHASTARHDCIRLAPLVCACPAELSPREHTHGRRTQPQCHSSTDTGKHAAPQHSNALLLAHRRSTWQCPPLQLQLPLHHSLIRLTHRATRLEASTAPTRSHDDTDALILFFIRRLTARYLHSYTCSKLSTPPLTTTG